MKCSNKLCLGTVQLGLKYGINNKLGRQPENQEVFAILDSAIQHGINYFDTASVYGNAEEILGNYGIAKHHTRVISKLRPNCGGENVLPEVKKSLNHLRASCLDGYLLHDAQDFYRQDILYGLQSCKAQGLIRNIGVSIYEPEDAVNVAQSSAIDYIQIPYNVFDQRLNETDFFELAEKNNIKVFARSAFLQGLLLMDVDKVPSNLDAAKPFLQLFADICESYHFTRHEAAFLFSYCNPGIDKVVFGVETKWQLEDNIDIINKAEDFSDCYKELYGRFQGMKRKIIVPSLWN